MLAFGGISEYFVRVALKNAGFKNMVSTMRLQTVKDHKLVTDGWFKYIRHPMYLGGFCQIIGGAFIFSSFYTLIFCIIIIPFFLLRIRIEEKMLLEEFGDEYEEYKKDTKKIIPFIY